MTEFVDYYSLDSSLKSKYNECIFKCDNCGYTGNSSSFINMMEMGKVYPIILYCPKCNSSNIKVNLNDVKFSLL